jgi:hypothetical protein
MVYLVDLKVMVMEILGKVVEVPVAVMMVAKGEEMLEVVRMEVAEGVMVVAFRE